MTQLRCAATGNLCGTDTWAEGPGHGCCCWRCIAYRDERIAALEAENARLKASQVVVSLDSQDQRRANIEEALMQRAIERARSATSWTHNCCDDCWAKNNPVRKHIRVMLKEEGFCCFCGERKIITIYVRKNPVGLKCEQLHKEGYINGISS